MDWIDEAKKQVEEAAQQKMAERQAAQDAAAAAANDHRHFLEGNATRLKEVVQRVERHVRRASELGLSSAQTCEGHGVWISGSGSNSDRSRPSKRSIHVTPSRPGVSVEFHYEIREQIRGFQVRKSFNLEGITEDRILQWLRWVATGEGRPWGRWSYQTRTETQSLSPQYGDRWGPWR